MHGLPRHYAAIARTSPRHHSDASRKDLRHHRGGVAGAGVMAAEIESRAGECDGRARLEHRAE